MISLLALKKFIAEKKLVNLPLILQTFGTKQEETLAILELLIHKGCVKKYFKTLNCATPCLKCSSESLALYQWIEQACLTPSTS
ncbi:MAG TPA: FeoC-like transcriptional regulator [Candidatus Aquirickettsiella sp.]|jgi:hypothetical protein